MRMKRLLLIGFLVVFVAGCTSDAKRNDAISEKDRCLTVYTYDLDSGYDRMDAMLQQLLHATGCTIDMDYAQVGPMRPHAVIGRMSIIQAVKTAISDSPLILTHPQPGVLAVSVKAN